jgi:hypothetical protein
MTIWIQILAVFRAGKRQPKRGEYRRDKGTYMGDGVWLIFDSFYRDGVKWCEYRDGDYLLKFYYDFGGSAHEYIFFSGCFNRWDGPNGLEPISAEKRADILAKLDAYAGGTFVDHVLRPERKPE